MKTVKLTCQNCGANLDVKDNIAFCSYCGSQPIIDDGNRTITHVNEARIRESERKEKIRLKELENEENEKKREYKMQKWLAIGFAFFVVVVFSIPFIMMSVDRPKNSEIRIPCSASDFKGQNYTEVVQELEDMGFSDVKTSAKKDLITGWFTKNGSVEKVSINGDTDFEEGNVFPNDAKIVVTYHTFKD